MGKSDDIIRLWQSYSIVTPAELDLRLHSFSILFAYHSGKIENQNITYHDTREIFENGKVLNYTGDPRTLFEVENQKKCYEFLKGPILSKQPITLELIKEVHAILTAGTYDERRFIELGERPGEFKKHDFVTGVEEVGASHEDVEDEMAEMLDVLAESEGSNPLKLAAWFHLRFEYIHPFADGNGRVGRAMMNYYLMTHNHPPVIIYDDDKADYYAALEQYDKAEEMQPMYAFLMAQLEKTWDKTLERGQQRSDAQSDEQAGFDASTF